jgi:hypothetical protein
MDTNAIPKTKAYLIRKAIKNDVNTPPHMTASHN